jgi:hypothetical protein
MAHEVLAFLVYYGCAFCVHLHVHLKHSHKVPSWAEKSRAHKVAAITATTAVAAGYEGVQGYVIHLLVYSGYFL